MTFFWFIVRNLTSVYGPGVVIVRNLSIAETNTIKNDVFVVPVMAMRDGDRVFLRDDEDRLRVREVSVLRRTRGQIVIDGGLEAGDHVLISPLRIYTEGMSLRTLEADAS